MRTSLDFKFSKIGWFTNRPDFKWDLKSRIKLAFGIKFKLKP